MYAVHMWQYNVNYSHLVPQLVLPALPISDEGAVYKDVGYATGALWTRNFRARPLPPSYQNQLPHLISSPVVCSAGYGVALLALYYRLAIVVNIYITFM